MDFINTLMPNFERLSGELYECIGQTFTMLAVSGSIAWVLGVAVGVLLTVCRPGGILENRWLFTIFDRGIDIIRSIPFIILIVLRLIVSLFFGGGLFGTRRYSYNNYGSYPQSSYNQETTTAASDDPGQYFGSNYGGDAYRG